MLHICLVYQAVTILLLTCESVGKFAGAWLNHRQKRERRDERPNCNGDPSLEHQTECFSQQSAGLRGDGVVISWQREAGHVGTGRSTSKTVDLGNAVCTHTLSVSVSDLYLSLSLLICLQFSYTLILIKVCTVTSECKEKL